MKKQIALLAVCALALLSASPALALNKSRLIAGVEDYNNGVNDGTITSTFLSTPVLSYQLTITSPAFSSGIAGVNLPSATLYGPRFSVPGFTSFEYDYVTNSGNKAPKRQAATVQDLTDGLYYTVEGTAATITGNSSLYHIAYPASAFQSQGMPANTTVTLADMLFFGGSNHATNSITVSNFSVNGSTSNTVANGFFVFATQPDLKFNFTP